MQQQENLVQLIAPIVRGETIINSVEVTKPNAGALRGTRLVDLAGSDVEALITVLPRITLPNLTKSECLNLDPVDLIELGGRVIGFLSAKPETSAGPTA
ncbi:phage tail assembly protein [Erwinia sp. Eh17-17]|jgi:hypothetical protein|uniref:phage tail assembly protein n=1 Tax=Erwinia sp. Eh17-17 TaxID=3080330 RepID=UPI0032098148